jgi:hypothetical protein
MSPRSERPWARQREHSLPLSGRRSAVGSAGEPHGLRPAGTGRPPRCDGPARRHLAPRDRPGADRAPAPARALQRPGRRGYLVRRGRRHVADRCAGVGERRVRRGGDRVLARHAVRRPPPGGRLRPQPCAPPRRRRHRDARAGIRAAEVHRCRPADPGAPGRRDRRRVPDRRRDRRRRVRRVPVPHAGRPSRGGAARATALVPRGIARHAAVVRGGRKCGRPSSNRHAPPCTAVVRS